MISDVQWQYTNQHSLSSLTSPHHLKLQPCGRQIAQHISWSQGHSTSPLISESILQTSTLVWTTSDRFKQCKSNASIYITLLMKRLESWLLQLSILMMFALWVQKIPYFSLQESKDLCRPVWILEQSLNMIQCNNQSNKYSTPIRLYF